MSTVKKSRDYVYLAIISIQLLGMLVLDLVEFYPKFIYEPPNAPLHFLADFRTWFIGFSGDPYFAAESHEPWFQLFLASEGLIQLPFAVYLVSQFASSKASSGKAELAAVVFGTIVALSSSVCCFDIWHMGPDVLADDKRNQILYGTYLPFSVIPTVMVIDMYSRLLTRLTPSQSKSKRS